MRRTTANITVDEAVTAQHAQVLRTQVEVGHKTQALRHVRERPFPVLHYREDVDSHGSALDGIERRSDNVGAFLVSGTSVYVTVERDVARLTLRPKRFRLNPLPEPAGIGAMGMRNALRGVLCFAMPL